ncbi:GAF domain-containing protein [Polluticoccus soli]|uniref:GAF domain-containing protein n=1 Tax=Polluticoccus soli TaxID=3034150 RepID=UPI0023E1F1C0|nr:GAF domain-containing protein [Flavipsychrobacter sp. JY13-12]
MTYSLYGTPCENVVGRNCCYFPSGVQQMFPDDKELQDLKIESYIGTPLMHPNGEPLGLIVLMNESKIQHAGAIELALSSIAERISHELIAVVTVAT